MTAFEIAPSELWSVLGYGCGALATGTLIAAVHPKIRKQTKVRSAIHSWWPVIIVAVLGTLLGSLMTRLVFATISAVLVIEGMKLLDLPPKIRKAYTALGIVLTLVCHTLVLDKPWIAVLLPIVLGIAVLPVIHMIFASSKDFMKHVAGSQWILASSITQFLFVSLLVLHEMNTLPYGGPGVGILFFVLVIVADAMQFVGGKIFGKTLLIPHISPGKTREGLLFGIFVCGFVGFMLAPKLLGVSAWVGVALGSGVCALSLAGDLIVSAWKRDIGVKDTGTILPGQGGILDRCDSILYVAPWFWVVTNFVI